MTFFKYFLFGVLLTLSDGLVSTHHDHSADVLHQSIDWSQNYTIELVGLNSNEFLLRAPQVEQPAPIPAPEQPNRRWPCDCTDLRCGCCGGMNIRPLNFKRILCTNFTYDPSEFAVKVNMMMNDDYLIYENTFSGKNPPPACAPVPYTPAEMCVKMFNVFTPGRNLHMCMDMELKVRMKPYMILHFDCMRMGQDGVTLLKPEDNGGEVGTGGGGGGGAGGAGGGGGGGIFGLGLFNRPGRPTTSTESPEDNSQVAVDILDPVDQNKIKKS